jgi:hypothetical protein
VEARIIGHCEPAHGSRVTIQSAHGEFTYQES